MRRNRLVAALGIATSGVVLAAGSVAGFMPAGASTVPTPTTTPTTTAPRPATTTTPTTNPVQSTVQRVTQTVTSTVNSVTAPRTTSTPSTRTSTSTTSSSVNHAGSNPLGPLTQLPLSLSIPITIVGNEISGNLIPGQDSTTGTNTTTQVGPLINLDAPINLCSVSVAVAAPASSSCSTTSVGINQVGAIGTVNIPITITDNAIALFQAASALGLTSGQAPASTTQNGAINAWVPISVCSINVGLGGNTASNCNTQGTSGSVSQTGVIDAAVPVTVCDVIAEIGGNSTANCPQYPDSTSQHGQLADLYAPATVCGVIVEVQGTATGSCMPVSNFPLVNQLPTNTVTQSAPIDGVLPINACSIVIAVSGTASNQCEPTHEGETQGGQGTINVPVTVCAVTAALQGTATGTCTGPGGTTTSIGTPGSPGSGVTVPITICGIEAALGGTANSLCPQPTVTTSPSTAPTKPTPVPVSLASTAPPAPAHAAAPPAAAPSSGSTLANTGAPLLLELAIGAAALLLGLAVSRLGRRQAGRHAFVERSATQE